MITSGKLTLPRSFHRLGLGLVSVTAVLAVTAVCVTILAAAYQQRINEASRYNRTFDAAQTQTELLRLQLAIAGARNLDDLDEVRLRIAILKNRTSLLDNTSWPIPEMHNDFIPRLSAAVQRVEPLIDRLLSAEAAAEAEEALKPLVQPLARMTARSHALAGDDVATTQSRLRTIFTSLCAVTLMLVIFGAALVMFVFRQNHRLDRTARTDALTGLANRLQFAQSLDRIATAGSCAVILIDVDHFKAFNDSNGHDVGDSILLQVSNRLMRAATDATLVARVGGDEFAILYEGDDIAKRSRSACQRILELMREPVVVDTREIKVGVTLGFRTIENLADERSSTALLKDADIALYEAKAAGRGRATEFNPSMKRAFDDRHRLKTALQGAIARCEHHLQFQPVVDLKTSTTLGFEALLRWDHPEFGSVPPSQFIPLAEESDLILELGQWVLIEAVATARHWPGDAFVAVNISARQLNDAGFAAFVADVLLQYRFPAERLEIEVTETALVQNEALATQTLQALRNLGCRIALDDFGTGYASLSYLQRFVFDKLKIDRSFVESCRENENSSAIVAAVCTLANRLRLGIVAEGIETLEHRAFVAEAGCGLGQGYLFDRPLPKGMALMRLTLEAAEKTKFSLSTAVDIFRKPVSP